MPRLFLNVDHVATVRQARRASYPDPVEAALLAESTGTVHGITVHLREDRRHIQDADVTAIRRRLALPLNFEMSCAPEIVAFCVSVSPPQATLVPERREEVTTEGGLDLVGNFERVRTATRTLQAAGIAVSLFIDPDAATVERARDVGATHVELHTGRYCDAAGPARRREWDALAASAAHARALGLEVNAGHGLTAENVGPVAAISGLTDLNIGHSLVARAIFVGLPQALREMRDAMDHPSPL